MGYPDAATDRCATARKGDLGNEAGEDGPPGTGLQSAAVEDQASALQSVPSAEPHTAVEKDGASTQPALQSLRRRTASRKTLYQPHTGRPQKAGSPDPAAPLRGKQVRWEERVRCLWFDACSCDQDERAEVALVGAADGPMRRLRPQRKREEGQKDCRGVEATILKSPSIVTLD